MPCPPPPRVGFWAGSSVLAGVCVACFCVAVLGVLVAVFPRLPSSAGLWSVPLDWVLSWCMCGWVHRPDLLNSLQSSSVLSRFMPHAQNGSDAGTPPMLS
jgi:hypothetical protein